MFELLYLNVFSTVAFFDKPFLVVAVMVTRVISYYGCLIFSGIFTLAYHVSQNGGKIKYVQALEGIAEIKPAYSADFEKSVEEAAALASKAEETAKKENEKE